MDNDDSVGGVTPENVVLVGSVQHENCMVGSVVPTAPSCSTAPSRRIFNSIWDPYRQHIEWESRRYKTKGEELTAKDSTLTSQLWSIRSGKP